MNIDIITIEPFLSATKLRWMPLTRCQKAVQPNEGNREWPPTPIYSTVFSDHAIPKWIIHISRRRYRITGRIEFYASIVRVIQWYHLDQSNMTSRFGILKLPTVLAKIRTEVGIGSGSIPASVHSIARDQSSLGNPHSTVLSLGGSWTILKRKFVVQAQLKITTHFHLGKWSTTI